MKKILNIIFAMLCTLVSNSQVIDAESIIDLLALSEQKLIKQLQKKGFTYKNTDSKTDTIVKVFNLNEKPAAVEGLTDTTQRLIKVFYINGEPTITYHSKSLSEISYLKASIKKMGFYCSNNKDSSNIYNNALYQHNNFTATIYKNAEYADATYSIKFHRKIFPDAKSIFFADDLLHFTSHEYLVYYFGEENVKKDIYFFEGNEISKCSVLFSGTKRQVVFIWEDDENKRNISNLLFGGQQKLKSFDNKENFIAESSWLLKSGLYAGMSLFELRSLNNGDFNFYAGNAVNTGLVLENNEGNINFKKEKIILGCINCTDENYRSTSVLSVDKAIKEGRILFVLSVVISPLH